MKHKAAHEEEHENAERYLITYADLITLLLGLFIILYVSADQDTKKFRKMMEAMNAAFGGSASTGAPGMGAGPGGDKFNPKSSHDDPATKAGKEVAKQAGTPGVKVIHDERGIVIQLQDSLFFESGSAAFTESANTVLAKVGPILEKTHQPIRVEGHADDRPISTPQFHSNWHLSAARALAVAEILLRTGKIPPSRLQIAGYGDTRPVAPNTTEEGRRKNRRVEIVLLKEGEDAPGADVPAKGEGGEEGGGEKAAEAAPAPEAPAAEKPAEAEHGE